MAYRESSISNIIPRIAETPQVRPGNYGDSSLYGCSYNIYIFFFMSPNFVRDKGFTWGPNHEEHHQSLTLRGLYTMKIRKMSRPGFEPRICAPDANHEATAALNCDIN